MANRIDLTLGAIRASGETALAPFLTIGFPDVEMSEAIAAALVASGGDMLELGISFSDPLADGPTVQKSSSHALKQGVSVRTGLKVVRRLRDQGIEAPLLLMGYFNPFLRYGLAKTVRDASGVGVDGLIVPDLPPEEAGQLKRLCERRDVYLIPLVAPTSTDERIAQACKHAKGFIYCVSLIGVTGARDELRKGVAELVGRIRRHTNLPVLVGFGVSRREHVEAIGQFADGAIVGTALIDAIDKAPHERAVQTASDFIKALRNPS